MDKERLEEIRERAEADLILGPWEFGRELRGMEAMAVELLAEVDRLNGRLEAVCGVVSNAVAFGDHPEPGRIMEAVRGE